MKLLQKHVLPQIRLSSVRGTVGNAHETYRLTLSCTNSLVPGVVTLVARPFATLTRKRYRIDVILYLTPTLTSLPSTWAVAGANASIKAGTESQLVEGVHKLYWTGQFILRYGPGFLSLSLVWQMLVLRWCDMPNWENRTPTGGIFKVTDDRQFWSNQPPQLLTVVQITCGTNGNHEGPAIWLFHFFMRTLFWAVLNAHTCWSRLSQPRRKGKLKSYSQIVNSLIETYATEHNTAVVQQLWVLDTIYMSAQNVDALWDYGKTKRKGRVTFSR